MNIVVLITGLSGSGKTTIAKHVQEQLSADRVLLIDGDKSRKDASVDLGFSKEDRFEHLKRMAILASDAIEEICIVASIAPYRQARAMFRESVGQTKKVLVIYNSTPLSICELRDPKGLYKKARTGEIKAFTGISDPYEIPENPDLEIDSSIESIETSVQRIISVVEEGQRKK